jgi:hypothetical protein
VFRVSHPGERINEGDTIEGIREIVRCEPAGRYDVDEIRAAPFPSGHTSVQMGRLIRHPDKQRATPPGRMRITNTILKATARTDRLMRRSPEISRTAAGKIPPPWHLGMIAGLESED